MSFYNRGDDLVTAENEQDRLKEAEKSGDVEAVVDELEGRVIEESEDRGAAGTPSDRATVEQVEPDHRSPG